MILAATIGVLAAGGVYLTLQRGMVRVVIGLALLAHAVNLLLMSGGVTAWRAEPLTDAADPAAAADPVPQAFVLTAIVISLAVTIVLLSLAVLGGDDDTQTVPDTGQEHDR